ncbi:MAG: transposase, partial [Bacteroidota bacterium]|nr:transposase [Bacteroidota bacterium]
MYIRERAHKLKNGEVRIGYGLLECRRVRGKPTQKTILNLGRDFNVPEPDWKVLTDRVAAILRGEPLLPLESEAVRTSAEDIARRLKAKGYDIHAPLDDRDLVITDEMRHIAIRSVGGERVGLHALEHLGFMDLLRELGFSETRVRIAAALVIGRMMSPGSEAHTYNWMLERSAILELLDLEVPCANSLYRVGDQLYAHREALMQGLFDQSQQLFGFEESILFYDLTDVYYHGKERSKEKRADCPLVTLALALDASGFPVRAEILEGSVSEPKTLKSALSRLNGRKVTVIMDAGIISAANLAWLKAQELDWICV